MVRDEPHTNTHMMINAAIEKVENKLSDEEIITIMISHENKICQVNKRTLNFIDIPRKSFSLLPLNPLTLFILKYKCVR